ncbi:MAG: formyl transferase, partial [Pseudomonadota bacterium]
MQDKLKVVVFVCHGSFQAYLCHQLAQQFDVVGCVIESSSVKPTIWSRLIRYLNPVRLAQYLICKLVLPRQRQKANLVLAGEYDGYSSELQLSNAIKSLVVSDIHSPEVQQFVRELEPDVACVNGTRLIRAQLLALLSRLPKGVINLHTGLSPYSRGGNCILFELLEGRPEAIGGTIHFLDSGIDSGDILLTYRPMISRCDNYQTLNGRVFLEGT